MCRFLRCCPLSGDRVFGDRQIGGYSASRPGGEVAEGSPELMPGTLPHGRLRRP
jgi:hypothetical protein